MDKIQINGQKKLKGKIRISGSKNSCLPILAASLLSDKKKKLKNVPRLSDVFLMIKILESLNSHVSFKKDICEIRTRKPEDFNVSYDLVRQMRASFLILGPLLARYGSAEVSLPGGCAIGTRPVDLHIAGLKSMGAKEVSKTLFLYLLKTATSKKAHFKHSNLCHVDKGLIYQAEKKVSNL